MQLTSESIKKIISILATGIILLNFIITIFTTDKNSSNYLEYTDLSKFFINLYTLILLILIFCHTIYPKIICSIFSKGISIIVTEKGKIILLSAIFIMYFGTGNKPQKIFGMISFICTFGLFLSNLYCRNLKNNLFTEENKIKNYGENNSKIATTESFMAEKI